MIHIQVMLAFPQIIFTDLMPPIISHKANLFYFFFSYTQILTLKSIMIHY